MPTIEDRFQLRGGLRAAIVALNEIPLRREMIVELDNLWTTGELDAKIGDGTTHYVDLPYLQTGSGGSGGTTITLDPTVPSTTGANTAITLPDNPSTWVRCTLDGLDYLIPAYQVAPGADPYYSNVVSLMNFNGATGTGNITDEKGHTWVLYSGATVTDSGPIFAPGSLSVPTNGYIRSSTTLFAPGSGDWTMEGWFNPGGTTPTGTLFSCRDGTNGVWPHVHFSGTGLTLYLNVTSVISNTSMGLVSGTPCFVELSYVGSTNTWYLFANGVLAGSYVEAIDTTARTITLGISSYAWNSVQYNGLIDSFRYTQGVARHTTAYTPPTQEFPNY